MRQALKVTFLLALFSASLFGQDNKPFDRFENRLKEERAGFAGNKEALSKVFNTERIHLGDRFEAELPIYLDNDVEKHYWISFFLEAPSYLHGSKPLPHFALLVKQQALSLLRGKTDRESLYYEAKLGVTAAVLSQELGLRILADVYKLNAERILALDSESKSWFPAMDEYDRCLYTSIGMDRRVSCQRKEAVSSRSLNKAPISGGVLNGKAISKPSPAYPEAAKAQRASGVVTVQIAIDEEGKVVSAVAVSGHLLLLEAAVKAARQARFLPTRLSGQPVKVVGVVTYNFEIPKR